MQFSSKFTVALHILLYIMRYEKEEKITSEVLAESTGVNPVNIRKILSLLKIHNIIGVKRGIGGTYLIKEPKNISLKDIFEIVEDKDKSIFKLHDNINTDCPVGKSIKNIVENELFEIQKLMFRELEKITLEEFYNKI